MGAGSRSGEWPAEERPPALTDGLFETEEEGGGRGVVRKVRESEKDTERKRNDSDGGWDT